MKTWTYAPPPPTAILALSTALGLSPVLAEVLVGRGLGEPQAAESFLRPRLADLEDPFRLHGLEAAAKALDAAMTAGQPILIFGDYDVDGVTSTVLLVSLLRAFGAQPRFAMPRRMDEGYGLSRRALERVFAAGPPALFIALDCGTNAVEEVAWVRAQGSAVIIVDHHQSKAAVPADCHLVNPHLHAADGAPWEDLCTVGLVFKLAHGLVKLRRAAGDAHALEMKLAPALDLVALGTIADLVPLAGENRILARHGLRALEKCERPGLRALFAVSGLQPGQSLGAADVSYRLGPRINASGRLGDAVLPVELLLGTEPAVCARAAAELDALNRERQNLERRAQAEAVLMVEAGQRDAPALVVYSENWHPGVVGIVAGKLCRQFGRPCIALGHEGAQARGSGRSVPGLNLVEIMRPCAAWLESWGGHPMAVGVALAPANLAAFRTAFVASVSAHQAVHGASGVGREIGLAAWLQPRDLGEDLLRELDLLHPFGEANPEPIFGVRGVRLAQAPEIFREVNYRCRMPAGSGKSVPAVAWHQAARLPPQGTPLDFAVKFQWNIWNGRQLPQLEVVDWRKAE